MTAGALTRVASLTLPAGCAPYGITTSPTNSNFAYVVSSGNTAPGIVQISINQTDGTMTQVGSVVPTNNSPRRAVISPDGKHMYVTVTGYDKVTKFDINQTDGTLSNRVDYTGNAFCQFIAVSAEGDHVYVANNAQANAANGNVAVYLRNKSDGTLTLKQNFTLAYVWGIAISQDGKGIYVSQTNGNIVALNRDANSGSGTYGQIISTAGTYTLPSGTNNAVAITNDNLFVYVLSDADAQYTEAFSRVVSDNTLVRIGHPTPTNDNNNGNWDIALSNDANQTALYSAISDGQEVAQFVRDPVGGGLTVMVPGSAKMSNYVSEPGTGSAGPYGITVLKNNKYLIATSDSTANVVNSFSIEQPANSATVTSVTVSPATATVSGGATQQFTASVVGTNSPAQTVVWSGTGVNASGLFTAPGAIQTPQTITITATSTVDGTKAGTATITVPAVGGGGGGGGNANILRVSNDLKKNVLRGLGYTGTVNDMEYNYWKDRQ